MYPLTLKFNFYSRFHWKYAWFTCGYYLGTDSITDLKQTTNGKLFWYFLLYWICWGSKIIDSFTPRLCESSTMCFEHRWQQCILHSIFWATLMSSVMKKHMSVDIIFYCMVKNIEKNTIAIWLLMLAGMVKEA